jgi:hypothetical protein
MLSKKSGTSFLTCAVKTLRQEGVREEDRWLGVPGREEKERKRIISCIMPALH